LFAREALEWLYSNAACIEVGDLDMTGDFLNENLYNMVPAVRAIDYQLRALSFTQPLVECDLVFDETTFEKKLAPLLSMDLRPGFTVTITIENREDLDKLGLCRLFKLLHCLRHCIAAFQWKGPRSLSISSKIVMVSVSRSVKCGTPPYILSGVLRKSK
jgi:hypothetical protein